MNKQMHDLQTLMTRLDFPADAQQTFLTAIKRILDDEDAASLFARLLAQYEETEQCDYKQMLADMSAMGSRLGIHEYTAAMLLFLCMAPALHQRYIRRELDESIYYNTLSDLRYKLEEGRLVEGVDGFFGPLWFAGFFQLTRFALHRLQFEIVTSAEPMTIGSTTVPAGMKAINIHIPRTGGKLDHNEVLQSYRAAAELFASEFEHQPVIFICTTWLLDPWNMTVLSPESNLSAFYRDFRIINTGVYPDYAQVWRLFDRRYNGDPADLPRDSSLRRAYAERIERGEPTGWGTGIFLYRDGKILHEL